MSLLHWVWCVFGLGVRVCHTAVLLVVDVGGRSGVAAVWPQVVRRFLQLTATAGPLGGWGGTTVPAAAREVCSAAPGRLLHTVVLWGGELHGLLCALLHRCDAQSSCGRVSGRLQEQVADLFVVVAPNSTTTAAVVADRVSKARVLVLGTPLAGHAWVHRAVPGFFAPFFSWGFCTYSWVVVVARVVASWWWLRVSRLVSWFSWRACPRQCLLGCCCCWWCRALQPAKWLHM